MVTITDLKQMTILDLLNDQMLEKLVPLTKNETFKRGHVIYKEGELAEKFYMLQKGKVLLEQRITTKATVTIGTISPGDSFGIASLLDARVYNYDAICCEPSDFLVMKGDDLLHLLHSDHSLGFTMMQKITELLKDQLDRRTEQFLRTIKTHPDIHDLEQLEEKSCLE